MYSLVGVDGNAYALMGYTVGAMKDAGFDKSSINTMLKEAKASTYENLICVCSDYIDKVNEKLGLTEEDEYDE